MQKLSLAGSLAGAANPERKPYVSPDPHAGLRAEEWRDARRVITGQAVALVVVGAAAAIGWGGSAGLGAVIGAGIGLLANVYLAVALFRKPLARRNAGSVMISWFVKVTLTLSLLLWVMRAKIVPPPAVIVGLFSAIVGHWVAVSFKFGGHR